MNRGQYNFDEIRLEYFRDRTAERRGAEGGHPRSARGVHLERPGRIDYNIAAVREGRLVKEELPDQTMSGAQGFFINLRRDKFADPAVRKALDLAFDFEWSNANLFYGVYARTQSVFEGGDLKASGLPGPQELALLEPLKSELRPEVFGAAYEPPKSDASGPDRRLLKRGLRASRQGRVDGQERHAHQRQGRAADDGVPDGRQVVRAHDGALLRNLRLLGIEATVRHHRRGAVSSSGSRTSTTTSSSSATWCRKRRAWSSSSLFGSESAMASGSYNLAGIALKPVDALIDADDRGARTATSCSMPAGPSTACSGRGTSGCRTGRRSPTTSSTGTSSGGPP